MDLTSGLWFDFWSGLQYGNVSVYVTAYDGVGSGLGVEGGLVVAETLQVLTAAGARAGAGSERLGTDFQPGHRRTFTQFQGVLRTQHRFRHGWTAAYHLRSFSCELATAERAHGPHGSCKTKATLFSEHKHLHSEVAVARF